MKMRNIQVIDSAANCTFSIFQIEDESFKKLFPEEGQNIEFMEDLVKRIEDAELQGILDKLWTSPVRKEDAMGIHGTLFCRMEKNREFYSEKKEESIDSRYINAHQRKLFKSGS